VKNAWGRGELPKDFFKARNPNTNGSIILKCILKIYSRTKRMTMCVECMGKRRPSKIIFLRQEIQKITGV